MAEPLYLQLDLAQPSADGTATKSANGNDSNAVENCLKSWSLDIIRLFNTRNVREAYDRFASPDHTYTQAIRQKDNIYLDREEAIDWMQNVVFGHPSTYCEITDCIVDAVPKVGFATVWISMNINDNYSDGIPHWGDYQQDSWPGEGKVSRFEWKTDETGQWKWINHQCLSAMPPTVL